MRKKYWKISEVFDHVAFDDKLSVQFISVPIIIIKLDIKILVAFSPRLHPTPPFSRVGIPDDNYTKKLKRQRLQKINTWK